MIDNPFDFDSSRFKQNDVEAGATLKMFEECTSCMLSPAVASAESRVGPPPVFRDVLSPPRTCFEQINRVNPALERSREASPSKRLERLANERAESLAKKLVDTKSIESIRKELEGSDDIPEQIKRINEMLKKSGSSLRLKEEKEPDPGADDLRRAFGTPYKLELKDGGKTIQGTRVHERFLLEQRFIELHKFLQKLK